MINKDSVSQELKKLLTSRVFSSKKQASKLLEYVVNEKLAGRGNRITQYAIAVEALGKANDYCPTENPAVRVEAGRVRKLLEEYYLHEGNDSPLRIQLPIGSYEPLFHLVGMIPSINPQNIMEKSIQSVGPRIYISCQNPATVRDDAARNLLYSIHSNLPMILGRFRELRIALADHTDTPRQAEEELAYAYQQHRAEFVLRCEIQLEPDGFSTTQTLLHTLTHEVVWSGQSVIPRIYDPQLLETLYAQMIMQAFSLNRGGALGYWSRYWRQQVFIPPHYRVLVEHIHFLHEDASEASLQTFLEACRERTSQYHDDALAHLHLAVLCLYAKMLNPTAHETLLQQWRQLSLTALALNPGNALAHSIFALECYQRGDWELCQVEMHTARRTNPFDTSCGHLLAVGMCAFRNWDQAFIALGEVLGVLDTRPQPLRSLPCLYYFRQARFILAAQEEQQFTQLGGWATFGTMITHCQTENCRGCIHTLGNAIDCLSPSETKDLPMPVLQAA